MTSEDRDDVPAGDPILSDEGTESRSSRSSRKKRKQMPIWQETILLLGIALVLAVVIKAFFVQAFYIPSQSMEPGLVKNDRILVQKVSYWGGDSPRRGDVIVFKDPGGWLGPEDSQGPTTPVAKALAKVGLYPTGGHLVKRVIGVAGDTVECCDEEGRLSVNGYTLDEQDYALPGDGSCGAAPGTSPPCKLDVGPIPEGYVLVMGDNRSNSSDSTAKVCQVNETECSPTKGLVPVDDVVGKVFALVWPRDHMKRIGRPGVFEDVPGPE